jgi:hypothetical protein
VDPIPPIPALPSGVPPLPDSRGVPDFSIPVVYPPTTGPRGVPVPPSKAKSDGLTPLQRAAADIYLRDGGHPFANLTKACREAGFADPKDAAKVLKKKADFHLYLTAPSAPAPEPGPSIVEAPSIPPIPGVRTLELNPKPAPIRIVDHASHKIWSRTELLSRLAIVIDNDETPCSARVNALKRYAEVAGLIAPVRTENVNVNIGPDSARAAVLDPAVLTIDDLEAIEAIQVRASLTK